MMLDLLMTAGAAAQSLGGPDGIWAHIVHDFSNITEPAALSAFLQVLLIDVVLAGDHAIVVGALAAGDRKSVVEGPGVEVRVDLGGRRIIKKKNTMKDRLHQY